MTEKITFICMTICMTVENVINFDVGYEGKRI